MSNTPALPNPAAPSAALAAASSNPPITGPPFVRFRHEGVQPPSSVYIVPDDVFHVSFNVILNNQTATSVAISGRVLEPDGKISPFSNTYPVIFTSSNPDFFFKLTEGFLLSMTAALASGGPIDGFLFTSVDIIRGTPPNQITLTRLIAGYVSENTTQSWPQSGLKSISDVDQVLFSNPGTVNSSPLFAQFRAGITNNASALMLSFDLTTSATVGNRFLQLQMPANVPHSYLKTSPATIAASTTVHCSWAINDSPDQASIVQGTLASVLPDVGNLSADEINVNIIGAQSGDSITNPVGLWRGYAF